MVKLSVLLCIGCVAVTAVLACDRAMTPVDMTSFTAPLITIDLDLPVEDRLKPVHDQFKDKAKSIVDNILQTIQKDVGGPLGLFVLKQAMKVFLYARAPAVLFDEVHSYSKATNIAPEIIALMNVFYEFDGTACTTCMVRLPDNTLLFGSNLDFDFSKQLSYLAYKQEVKRGGKVIYYANGIYGISGILRGVVPGKFYVSINERSGKGDSFRNLFFADGNEALFHLRYILENATDYQSALSLAKNYKLLARTYYSIMGTNGNEGCVIERNENGIHAEYCLSDDVWYIVQTNTDRDLPDPDNDCRRNPAENYLNSVGKENMTRENLRYLLTHAPNHVGAHDPFDPDGTITTILGQHNQGDDNLFDVQTWDWDDFIKRQSKKA